ncbi:c-type cytochrome [Terrihabitans sp. B22-R8]|uniref:c-type cytochrome n=1 Tax=Terrihabitans sp. B22-R8 TaxID=3425128 RepID=UPI00403C1E6A
MGSSSLEKTPWRVASTLALIGTALLVGTADGQAQDADAGQKVFAVCRACHQVGPTAKNGVGPTLNGLFGRVSGTVEGYAYSPANKAAHLTWDEPTFTEFIKNPKGKIPGTKMAFAGVKDEQKIKDLIAYLHTFDGAPVTLAQP